MSYRQALDYLDSFLNYEKTTAYRYPEGFSLDRMERLLERLGNPHRRYISLHVAGTKGKGSTCAFAASILKEAGERVGLYTSPHLVSFRERIRVNGLSISEEDLAEVVTHVKPHVKEETTFFEVTTACAFVYFAWAKVEMAVVEVGLGGRLDSTNVLNPAVTAITPVSLDHVPKLGSTIEAIAREKAGIIKSGIPVVVAPQPKEALKVFQEVASHQKAPFRSVETEVQIEKVSLSSRGTRASFRTPMGLYPDLSIPLLGRHQLTNAAAAVRMVELFYERGKGEAPPFKAVQEGIAQTQWPGRCQWIDGSPPILLDGAQNAASALALRTTVEELFSERKVLLVMGVSMEKDLTGIASGLGPLADQLIVTQADVSRAESPERVAEAFRPWFSHPPIVTPVAEAIEQARELAGPNDLIVVTGSLFVVAEALQALSKPAIFHPTVK